MFTLRMFQYGGRLAQRPVAQSSQGNIVNCIKVGCNCIGQSSAYCVSKGSKITCENSKDSIPREQRLARTKNNERKFKQSKRNNTGPKSDGITKLLNTVDRYARMESDKGSGRDLTFFNIWWKDLYGRLLNASPSQISLLTGALGLLNWKTGDQLRRKWMLMRSHIHCLETQFLLGDDEKLDPRFYATLYIGLQRLYEFDNYSQNSYPSSQLVSKTIQYFVNKVCQTDSNLNSALTQFTWSLSQMKSCPIDKEFYMLTSLLHDLIVENQNQMKSYLNDHLACSSQCSMGKLPVNDFMKICIQQIQTAGAFLEWRTDPDAMLHHWVAEKMVASATADFWRDWYSLNELIMEVYSTDSIDWGDQKILLSHDIKTLSALMSYGCLEVATEFDRFSELFAIEPTIAHFLSGCITEDGPAVGSDIILALERALDNFSTKCKSKAVVMRVDRQKIPSKKNVAYLLAIFTFG